MLLQNDLCVCRVFCSVIPQPLSFLLTLASCPPVSASKLLNHLPLNDSTHDLLPLNCLTHDLPGHTISSSLQTQSPVNSVKMVILSQRPGAS